MEDTDTPLENLPSNGKRANLTMAIIRGLLGKKKLSANVTPIVEAKADIAMPIDEKEEGTKMDDEELQSIIQQYFGFFREANKNFTKGILDYEYHCRAFKNGVLLDIRVVDSIQENSFFYPDVQSFKEALEIMDMPIEKFLNDEDKEVFKNCVSKNELPYTEGSSIYIAGNRTFIIKGKDKIFWSQKAAELDANDILKFKSEILKKNVSTKIEQPQKHGRWGFKK